MIQSMRNETILILAVLWTITILTLVVLVVVYFKSGNSNTDDHIVQLAEEPDKKNRLP